MEDSTVNFNWIEFAQLDHSKRSYLKRRYSNERSWKAELHQTLVGSISTDFIQDHRIPQRK